MRYYTTSLHFFLLSLTQMYKTCRNMMSDFMMGFPTVGYPAAYRLFTTWAPTVSGNRVMKIDFLLLQPIVALSNIDKVTLWLVNSYTEQILEISQSLWERWFLLQPHSTLSLRFNERYSSLANISLNLKTCTVSTMYQKLLWRWPLAREGAVNLLQLWELLPTVRVFIAPIYSMLSIQEARP